MSTSPATVPAVEDYRLEVKVRNNLLLEAMEREGIESLPKLAKHSGVSYGVIVRYAALTRQPISKVSGTWLESAIRLAESLRLTPEYIFPEDFWRKSMESNRREFRVSKSDLPALIGGLESLCGSDVLALPPDEQVAASDVSEALEEAIGSLTPREELVLRMRFGIGEHAGAPMSLVDVGKQFGVTQERIRQVESKAIRKMRHPMRTKGLADAGVDVCNDAITREETKFEERLRLWRATWDEA